MKTLLEALELRQLLSGTLLAAGDAVTFDFNSDGVKDAILLNTGPVGIEYDLAPANALAINLLSDGARFTTNTSVQIGDTDPVNDFILDSAKAGASVQYGGEVFNPLVGQSTVQAASIGQLDIQRGDLLFGLATTGGIGSLSLERGDLYDLITASSVGTIDVAGRILGNVSIGGDLGSLHAQSIEGSVDGTALSVAGHVNTLTACRITGGSDGASLGIFVGSGLDKMKAGTITGGLDSTLQIDVTGGLGSLCVSLMQGAQTTASHSGSASLSVIGDIASIHAGTIVGGFGAGQAEMIINVMQQFDMDGNLIAQGDLVSLEADSLLGGNVSGDGSAKLTFNIWHDLVDAKVGQIVGSGAIRHRCDPSVSIIIGHDLIKLRADEITAGTASGADALAYVNIAVGHDIKSLCAGEISGGTTSGGGYAYVSITAEHDIVNFSVGILTGSQNRRHHCDPAVQIRAGNDIKNFTACRIVAGQDGVVNILAGMDALGAVTGQTDLDGFHAGSIEYMSVGCIEADDGAVNISASGDIGRLKVCQITTGDDGKVRVSAGGSMTVDAGSIQSWTRRDRQTGQVTDTGVAFDAGKAFTDVRHRINSRLVTVGEPVLLPTPIIFPE